jgi:hypothetical protein
MTTFADPGAGNPPPARPAQIAAPCYQLPLGNRWWHNTHRLAREPLSFSDGAGRFSAPHLPRKVLYLGDNSITCFWECGLGRNLRDRFLDDRTLRPSELEARAEYCVTLDLSSLRLFDSRDPVARRSIGARTVACFGSDYVITQQWAGLLMQPWARIDGIRYDSTRSAGLCIALFDTSASVPLIPEPRPAPLRDSFNNPELMAALLAEGVATN